MKLTKQDILNIDAYLKEKGIKFLDIRLELIDHLVSEYENLDNYPDLESFLRKRVAWCRKISEKKETALHWGYQKDLWKRVWKFFKSPWFYIVGLVLGYIVFELQRNVSEKIFQNTLFSLFFSIMVFQFVYLGYTHFKPRIKYKLVSKEKLFVMLSIPHMFGYLISAFDGILKENIYFLIAYIFAGSLINIAALVELNCKQKEIVKHHNFLKNYFA